MTEPTNTSCGGAAVNRGGITEDSTTNAVTTLWRTRVTLPDQPGALASLTHTCAERGVNIVALEVLPGIGSVTDELVLAVPASWDLCDVVRLLEDSGARPLLVGRAPASALADQAVRHLHAVVQLIEQPESIPQVLALLLDAQLAEPSPTPRPRRADRHHLVLSAGGETIDLVREAPFTPTEQARADSVIDLARRLDDAVAPPEPAPAGDHQSDADRAPELRRHADLVIAEVEGRKVGESRLIEVGAGWGVRVFVHPSWRRRGIGAALLGELVAVARGRGIRELDVRLDAHDLGGLRLVLASGLCGSVSCDGQQTRTRLVLGVGAAAVG